MRCAAERPIVTRRVAKGDFADLEAARADGAYDALEQALAGAPDDVLRAIEDSGERGRGGAGFPTGRKWRAGAEAAGDLKYVIANGDEGDPGSFIDRVLMERDPHAVLEGLALCAWAVGAAEGIVYVRCEYPEALRRMQEAVAAAEQAGVLGQSVLGSRFCFRVTVFPGMGSYVCGEETAMLNAIEGFRGEVRLRPPYPTESGLHGRPTIVNNVETLVNVPWIVANGARAYSALGTQQSSGTKAMCLNHGFARPGIVEVEFGMTLRELIETHGGGSDNAPLEAVILGGPMGSVLPPDRWDVPICYEAMQQRSIRLGHGGLVALPEGTDFRRLLVHWLEFMQRESCGKCVPCRIGSQRALELARSPADRSGLQRLLEVMTEGSLCAFGQLMPGPMNELLEHFGDRIFGDAS
jgi:NADH:ubiquinone oxidoreductase subunit F (NADH-binding)